MTKIGYVKEKVLRNYIENKISDGEFLSEMYDNGMALPGGLDHVDMFNRQVKIHCRGMNNININWIVRGK